MTNKFDTPPQSDSQQKVCPICGERYPLMYDACPRCTIRGQQFTPPETQNLKRHPTIPPAPPRRRDQLDLSETVMLQFLPSASCVTLDLAQPVVLGRVASSDSPDEYTRLDLVPFGGHLHGVSRRHCLLQRQENVLLATDLNSMNGTHLNDTRLTAHEPQVVAHGDRLILGTLHMVVIFSKLIPRSGG